MSRQPFKKSDSFTRYGSSQQELFFISNGIRKRKIFYNVDYSETEEGWIRNVRKALKKEKNIDIKEDQTILRYYYSADLELEKCLEKLVKYNEWFTSKEIQTVTEKTKDIFRSGFIYSYGKAKDGKPFIIMNLGILDFDKYEEINYYQAMNHVINRVVREEFVPGLIESYYCILDLEQKLLSLPLGSIGDFIKMISNAYSMFLGRMMLVNCTPVSKWIYNRLTGFIAEETAKKITLHTKEDIEAGQLKEFISEEVLQKKYGGMKPDINHQKEYQNKEKLNKSPDQYSQTQYFSIDQNDDFFKNPQPVCCSINQQCQIY